MNFWGKAWQAIVDPDGKTIIAMAKTSEARLKRSRAMLVREQRYRRLASERAEKAEGELAALKRQVEHLEAVVVFAKLEQKLVVKSHAALNALLDANIAIHSARKARAEYIVEREPEEAE